MDADAHQATASRARRTRARASSTLYAVPGRGVGVSRLSGEWRTQGTGATPASTPKPALKTALTPTPPKAALPARTMLLVINERFPRLEVFLGRQDPPEDHSIAHRLSHFRHPPAPQLQHQQGNRND